VANRYYWSTVAPSNLTGANTDRCSRISGSPRTVLAFGGRRLLSETFRVNRRKSLIGVACLWGIGILAAGPNACRDRTPGN